MDVIDILGFGLADMAAVTAIAAQFSIGVQLEFNTSAWLLIEGATLAELDAGDFALWRS